MRFLLYKLWLINGEWDRWTVKIIIIINSYIRKSTNSTLFIIKIFILFVLFRIKTTTYFTIIIRRWYTYTTFNNCVCVNQLGKLIVGWWCVDGVFVVLLIFYQTIDMMLCTMLRCRHFKHKCNAQQCLLCFFIWYYLRRKFCLLRWLCINEKLNIKFTWRMVKFSRTLFIMYFSGSRFSLLIKLIM